MKVAKGDQYKRMAAFLIVLNRLACSLEAFIVIIMEKDHASGGQTGIKVLQPG